MIHFKLLFEVTTVLNKKVRVTQNHWNKIISFKHPVMKNKEGKVKNTLFDPDEIRVSKNDPDVFLYYAFENKYYYVVVVRHLNGEGFVITAYITDRIKEGILVWKR